MAHRLRECDAYITQMQQWPEVGEYREGKAAPRGRVDTHAPAGSIRSCGSTGRPDDPTRADEPGLVETEANQAKPAESGAVDKTVPRTDLAESGQIRSRTDFAISSKSVPERI